LINDLQKNDYNISSLFKTTNTEQLISYFSSHGISQNEMEAVANSFLYKQLNKGDYFAQEGKTSKQLAFVAKGLFQYFHLKDGKEITTYIAGENTFLASVISFYKQQPGKENIRALANAELYVIQHDALMKLKNENNAFRSFYINALENLLTAMDETRTNLITLTGEERYAFMLREEPKLLQQIPLQYLASILGVTPRHLSRIRNNIR
jgi:CRP-like cAMP-binding protein